MLHFLDEEIILSYWIFMILFFVIFQVVAMQTT